MFSSGSSEWNYLVKKMEKTLWKIQILKNEKPPNFQKNGYLDILIEKIIH